MAIHHKAEVLVGQDEIVAPPQQRACTDQTFELPRGIFIAMVMLFTGFATVLAIAFPVHTVVTFGVIFVFLGAFFAIPTIGVEIAHDAHPRSWSEFMSNGIQTGSGHSSGASAAVLVLMLPVLIFSFAVAIVVINALT